MATFKNVTISSTGAMQMPSGTTAQRPASPSSGDLRFNTDLGVAEYYDGARWINALTGYPVVIASGGLEFEVMHRGAMYKVHLFESSGTLTVTQGGDMEYLIVAGGGGGGMDMGGGGGGGGVIMGSAAINSSQTITVGAGGYGAPSGGGGYRTDGAGPQPNSHHFTINGTNGGNSSAFGFTAIGGGYGGTGPRTHTLGGIPGAGGSGGGASGYNNGNGTPVAGGAGTVGQGFDGGAMGTNYYSGGGGGAAGPGIGGNSQPNGGPGLASNILGLSYHYGGGGGGASYSLTNGGNGGSGGGGGGAVGTSISGGPFAYNYGGTAEGGSSSSQTNTMGGDAGKNTGGGGGGGSHYNLTNKGGEGGSGIVIVRYPLVHTEYDHHHEEIEWINSASCDFQYNGYSHVNILPAFTKTANGWDAKAYTTAGFTAPFTLEWNKSCNPDGTNNLISYGMIGFRSGSATPGNNSYTDLEYAAYPYRHGSVRFYRSGSSQGDTGSAWSAGDKHRLVYGTDGWVRYYIGSSTRQAYNHGNATTVFYPQAALYTPGTNRRFGSFWNVRVIRAAWNGSNYVS